MDCPSSKYILDDDNFCLKEMLFTRGVQGEKGCPGPPGPPGPTGNAGEITAVRENVGCDVPPIDDTQQNIVLQPTSVLAVPENIVVRTFGIDPVYGNFIRDDSLTVPKGNIRGSGAVDLSVSRNACSQVASGDFSVIGGGASNTASGGNSVICGGEQNSANGLYSSVCGGKNNNNLSDYSIITNGISNTINSQSSISFIGSGESNNINDNIQTSNCFIGAGFSNSLVDSPFAFIGNGSEHLINTSPYSFIGNGKKDDFGQPIQLTNTSNAFIGNGRGLFHENNNFSSIINGESHSMYSSFSLIGGGASNANLYHDFSSVVGGKSNKILNNSFIAEDGYSSIIGGESNEVRNRFGGVQIPSTYGFIGNGKSNIIQNTTFSTILSGESNTISNNSIGIKYNSILGGFSNQIINNSENSYIIGGTSNQCDGSIFGCIFGESNSISSDNSRGRYYLLAGKNLKITNQDNTSGAVVGQFNKNGITNVNGWGFIDQSTLQNIGIQARRRFIVGNGQSDTTRNNAFSVLDDGIGSFGYAVAQTGFVVAGANADFAEYMESKYNVDGSDVKIPLGTSVVLDDQGFIMPSDTIGLESKVPVGVISGTASLTSNTALEEWSNKYLKERGVPVYEEITPEEEIDLEDEINIRTDEEGKIIRTKRPVYKTYEIEDNQGNVIGTEKIQEKIKVPIYEKENVYLDVSEVVIKKIIDKVNSKIRHEEEIVMKKIEQKETIEIIDDSGNIINKYDQPITINKNVKKQLKPKLNPSFDPTKEYKSRPERPEWNLVGLIGQVHLLKGQRTNPNWIKMRDINNNVELWLIR